MLLPKKTLQRHEVPGAARFLTFSCYRRLRLFDNDKIKNRFVDRLRAVCERTRVQSLAWVVMPEHVHLIVFSEVASIPAFLSDLKRPFSIEVLRRWRELNAPILPRLRDRSGDYHFWQAGGGYDRVVVGDELREKIAYVHRNPITRGLAATSVDWVWSSARRYEGRADAIGPEVAFDLVPAGNGPLSYPASMR